MKMEVWKVANTMPIISEFDDEMFPIPKISQLDLAIVEVIGVDELVQMSYTTYADLHIRACLNAFENKLEGPNVEILRVMLKYLRTSNGYPSESRDVKI